MFKLQTPILKLNVHNLLQNTLQMKHKDAH
jgi:hypothetical protein